MSKSLKELTREGLFDVLARGIATSVVKGDVKSIRKALKNDPELKKAADDLIASMIRLDKAVKDAGGETLDDIIKFV